MEYMYSEYLYHFGVPGMKWGHRKTPMTSQKYSSRVKKLRKLEDRYTRFNSKASELNYKAASKRASSTRRFFNSEARSAKLNNEAIKLEKRVAKLQRDANRARRKGVKIYKKTMKQLNGAKLSDFNKDDIAYAEKFAARYIN